MGETEGYCFATESLLVRWEYEACFSLAVVVGV